MRAILLLTATALLMGTTACSTAPRKTPVNTEALSPKYRVQCLSLQDGKLVIQDIPRSEVCSEGYRATGRISIQTAAAPGTPAQSFITQFELQGSATQGKLALQTPVGTTVAELHWQPGKAQLFQSDTPKEYASVEAMMQDLTGASIPMPLLFDWLQGKAGEHADWQVDLSKYALGVIHAKRAQPLPATEVRIKLDEAS